MFVLFKCSSNCGTGIQTRRVFCGKTDNDVVTKVDDSKCDPEKRYENTTECHVPADQCKGAWFAGPWSEVFDLFSFFVFLGLPILIVPELKPDYNGK